jgi:FAD/FMN-containing dehydrogenase
MLTRRQALQTMGASAAALALSSSLPAADEAGQGATGVVLNDVQSQLNPTRVHRVVQPQTVGDLQAALRAAAKENRVISVAGGRHAMGGQQFAQDALHIDTTTLKHVIKFDKVRGHIEVEAGIMWPELLDYLQKAQQEDARPWTIRQKQTGVDHVTIAGTLSANAHARGLRFKPFVDDIESFTLLDAAGKLHTCSRTENTELFSLAAGGYGLFGIITHATLRLTPRRKVQRVVEIIKLQDLPELVDARVEAGFLYGDCQYSTNVEADNAAHPGVFSCYRPVADDAPMPAAARQMTDQDWQQMYVLARTDKQKAFDAYAQHYLATNQQVYWSDLHQLAGNFDIRNLQEALVRHQGKERAGTEMITEVYVRPENLRDFLRAARQDTVDHHIDLTYGTIRFIEPDDATFLRWAKDRQVCILCNLHVVHTEAGKRKAAEDLRRLIGRALEFGGRYYLTYQRWATRDQVSKAYPQLVDFLKLKKKYDPRELFQSTWYQHYTEMYADKLG